MKRTSRIWAGSSDAFRMIQNTTVGRVTAGNAVPCNDTGGFTHWGPTVRTINWFHNTANQGAGKAAALQAAMGTADVRNRLAALDAEILALDARQFDQLLQAEATRWATLIKARDIKVDA